MRFILLISIISFTIFGHLAHSSDILVQNFDSYCYGTTAELDPSLYNFHKTPVNCFVESMSKSKDLDGLWTRVMLVNKYKLIMLNRTHIDGIRKYEYRFSEDTGRIIVIINDIGKDNLINIKWSQY